MNVNQIASGLADRFHLLTGGARSALPRQRTLEGSVDWSHDLLDVTEQIAFRRLAAFAGSFTLDAAEAVCAGDGVTTEQVLDLLSALVGRSLVQVVEDAGPQTRYRMLETIRDYARHKLTDSGETATVRDRHLDHCVSFAEQAATGLEGPDLVAWLARVDTELDDLRAAMDWSTRSADSERGVRLVGLLALYWFARSDLGIGRARLEATLDHASTDGIDRANALSALCMIAYLGGDMAPAARFGDEAIAIGRHLGDARTLGRALHCRAWVRFWGEADRFGAWADFEEAGALLAEADDRVFRALNAALHGWSCAGSSEEPRARALLTEALALSGEAPHARCYALVVLGWLDSLEGNLDSAAAHFEEGLTLAGPIGDHYVDIFAHFFLGYLELFRGRYAQARERSERGLAMALEHRSPNNEACMRLLLGFLALAEGDLDAAGEEADASFELFSQVMPLWATAFCRAAQALVALARSEHHDAGEYAVDALMRGRDADNVPAIEWALQVQAALARLDGDAHRAEDLLHDALDIAHHAGLRTSESGFLDALGAAVADQGRFEEAARLCGAAEGLRDTMGYVPLPIFQRSGEEDLARVRDALGAEAFDTAWGEGAGLTLDDAVAYARRGRGQRKRPPHGWNSLTPAELQVVALVAEGLTNPQIGERLLVSRRTVQAHLAHVFAKLGVSTRAELAAKTTQRKAANP
jgi:ATP/maltotriose-dependent transcriptional regulator MalT